MQRITLLALLMLTSLLFPVAAFATNGDNLIAVGPIARSMGGVGIAAPQDVISATFANPAAICSGPYCPSSGFDFAATLFAPKIDGRVSIGGTGPLAGNHQSRADEKTYLVPAFGISTPITPRVRMGLSAYGVTGLGVDHRNSELSGGLLAADSTQLMILKVAPTVAWQVTDRVSVGGALHVVNSQLDLNQGSSSSYGVGGQLGVIFKPTDAVSLGATYQSVMYGTKHKSVYNLDEMTTGSKDQDDFTLESPQTIGVGAAWKPASNLLLEVNLKWLNWSDAKGYDVLGWDDQLVYALGLQYSPITSLALRAGYNYGKNPIKGRSFNGDGIVNVQGKDVNAYGFETLRVIGFPAIVEHHVTLGAGYNLTESVAVNVGYMHAFQTSVKSNGTLPTAFGGNPVELESKVSEDAVDFSLSWRF